jgi:tetratricopeptide (TPR) repeat protein
MGDRQSIDRLLALTDEGWDIDEQVRTLQRASTDERASRIDLTPTGEPSIVSVVDLLPEAPASPKPHKPPPLPSGRTSGPPAAPISAPTGSARPPPLPPPGKKLKTPPPGTRPPLPRERSEPHRPSGPMPVSDALPDLLAARITALEGGKDRVGLSRAHLELAIVAETTQADDARAVLHAEAALKVDPQCAPAHAVLRRRLHGPKSIPKMLEHLDAEIGAATETAGKTELLALKARLLEASGSNPDATRAAWQQTIAYLPQHAAALKGLEVELFTRMNGVRGEKNDAQNEAADALQVHLAQMADAYGAEPRLAAWLHVERARILEHKLGKIDGARGALERALELDGSVGVVREAAVRFVAAHDDAAAFVALLDEEAGIEVDPVRCARLELDAACVASARLGDKTRAIGLLERAARRAPTLPMVDRRVLDELVRLHEEAGDWPSASRARRARLKFFTDGRALAYELRTLAGIAEANGDADAAVADIQAAVSFDPKDPTLVELLDRLLALADRQEQRMALWVSEAARTEEPAKRAKALVRAARIAEDGLSKPAEAIRHLRAAWVAAPGETEVLDNLSRLLSPPPSEGMDREVRGLVDLYAQAQEHAKDPERRIAYLEKCALLWEDVIGDARRASRAFEEILVLDPDRRVAILGLARTAARVGDGKAHARALLDEARLSEDGILVLSLRVRAANALAPVDPARALALVDEVLAVDPAHTAARALETRLHEEAGRWERAAESIRARIERASARQDKLTLWLALAQIQHQRLHKPQDALESLRAARAQDPTHPVPPEEIARVLQSVGDPSVHRTAIEGLAADAQTPEERAMQLVRAAELDELVLRDDARAATIYMRALADMPEDELIAERLVRVLARRSAKSGLGDLASLQAKRLERAQNALAARALSFDLASLLVVSGKDLPRASALLESVLTEEPGHIAALRTLEGIARRTGDHAVLARVLGRQGDALREARARLGALWALANVEEWRLPSGDSTATFERILALDPSDPGALEASIRRATPASRRGDNAARRTIAGAMRSLFSLASDDATRLAMQLRLALVLESIDDREALERFRGALHVDPLSVTAATGLSRLAAKLGDYESAFTAEMSLSELSAHPKLRSRHLLSAAEILITASGDALGNPGTRRGRAQMLLENALEADPDSIPAAARYSTVCSELAAPERLVDVFRKALRSATVPDSVVFLGSEIARVARDDLKNLPVAIDAMRRAREAAPTNVPTLLTLSELCVAQRAWPEAVNALEAVVAVSREAAPKLTALFALASIYERVLSKRVEAEKALRAALLIDDRNPRALRALLRFLGESAGPQGLSPKATSEMAELLERLSDLERDLESKTDLLVELASLRTQLGQASNAERALIEAVACSPKNPKIFARLASLFRTPQGRHDDGYARALSTVIARGQTLGAVSANWFATLGQLEVEVLGRLREGIAHLRQAIDIDPELSETRFELASAYSRAEAHDDAIRLLSTMVTPDSKRLLASSDPNVVLSLLERELLQVHRAEEALAVSELRAIGGDLDDGRHAWLRARRRNLENVTATLDRPTLVTQVLPQGTRHVLLEVAAAISGMESKILRSDISELGISSRDRISSRSGHPTRLILDRMMKMLGLEDIELVITPVVPRTRVIAQDALWIVVPKSLTELPEPAQMASIARALVRVALGVPWLEELPPPHIEALLIAAARQASPSYALDSVDVLSAKLVAQYEPSVQRAISRRQRKLLEELAPHMGSHHGKPPPVEDFVMGLARGELRGTYLLTGDLLAVIDDLRAADPALLRATERPGRAALQAVLEHPFAGDLCRFALTPEATGLRRRLGSTWTS